jgi:hypothetical protein
MSWGPALRWLADSGERDSLSARFRRRRFAWFVEELRITPADRILDLGGDEAAWLSTPYRDRVTVANIAPAPARTALPYVQADACDLGAVFDTGAFDVVFSNSVIEHVGDPARQRRFADEVRRVGRKYWVQTPYRHFPIEPHFLFPLFQYLPPGGQRWVGLRWKYSHLRRHGEDVLAELQRLRLLDRTDLRAAFPDATLLSERVLGLTKSLIAYRR